MAAKQTMCIWGDPATGKTALLATAARGYHQATGRKVRLVSAESAQSNTQFAGLIKDGVVDAWWLDARYDTPFERIWQAVLGYWPVDVNEPLSPVVPAFAYRYVAECLKCAQKPYDSAQAPTGAAVKAVICPKCKEPLMVRTVRVPDLRNGIDKVGMYLFEGLTEFGNMMMRDMNVRTAKGEKIGGDAAVRFQDGDFWVGSTTQSHYGTAQNQIKNRVDESKHLFGVDYVLWSAVRSEDKDKDNKRSGRVFGPKAPGNAVTGDIPRWFGPTLGTCLVPSTPPEYRLYLTTYFQTWDSLDAKVPNICNNRIPPAQLRKGTKDEVPDYYKVDPADETLLWRVIQLIEERQGASGAGSGAGSTKVSERQSAAAAPAAAPAAQNSK